MGKCLTDKTKLCVAGCGRFRNYRTMCKLCAADRAKLYEKTPSGFLMRTYRNMKNRTTGVLKKKAHLYKGLDLCDKKEFYEWSLRDGSNFLKLLDEYEASGYEMTVAPSIDRIIPSKGYVLSNLRWVVFSENSSYTSNNSDQSLPSGIYLSKGTYRVKKTINGKDIYKNCGDLLSSCNLLKTLLEDGGLRDTDSYKLLLKFINNKGELDKETKPCQSTDTITKWQY